MGWPHPYPRGLDFTRDLLVVCELWPSFLKTMLALAVIFALTALGIFLIRRSKPRP
jgi:hypothetical protein